MNKIDLKEIQRKITTSYFEDGIWDLAIGLIFLSFGLLLQYDLPVFVGVAAALIVTLAPLLKRAITLPRYGQFQLLQREKRRFSMLFLLTSLLGLAFFFFIFSSLNESSLGKMIQENSLIFLGIVWGAVMIFVGYWLSFQRLYIYAFLIAIPFITAEWIMPFPIKMIIAGGIITLIGFAVLVRFIQHYPKVNLPEV
ncbi:MAG: hypothetical protein CL609_20110 [Anaerolineaceae bacterium]|nr:hypothetical protein [Anaerolineaceae bacterium]